MRAVCAGVCGVRVVYDVCECEASWLDVRVLRALKFGRFIREGSRPVRAQCSPVQASAAGTSRIGLAYVESRVLGRLYSQLA